MAKLLDTALPLVPQEYDVDMMVLLLGTLENALTKTEIPAVISGLDDTNGNPEHYQEPPTVQQPHRVYCNIPEDHRYFCISYGHSTEDYFGYVGLDR